MVRGLPRRSGCTRPHDPGLQSFEPRNASREPPAHISTESCRRSRGSFLGNMRIRGSAAIPKRHSGAALQRCCASQALRRRGRACFRRALRSRDDGGGPSEADPDSGDIQCAMLNVRRPALTGLPSCLSVVFMVKHIRALPVPRMRDARATRLCRRCAPGFRRRPRAQHYGGTSRRAGKPGHR